jgi:hypothetical protein
LQRLAPIKSGQDEEVDIDCLVTRDEDETRDAELRSIHDRMNAKRSEVRVLLEQSKALRMRGAKLRGETKNDEPER